MSGLCWHLLLWTGAGFLLLTLVPKQRWAEYTYTPEMWSRN